MAIFSDNDQERIREAIAAAERSTSGEIRVCIDKTCNSTPIDRAVEYFNRLEMNKTKLRNGVLIYLSVNDRQFAIIGDAGINQAVPENFWDGTKELMLAHFKKGELAEGIIAGIQQAGQQLKAYFPSAADDQNELSNDIAFGDED